VTVTKLFKDKDKEPVTDESLLISLKFWLKFTI